MDRVQAAHRSLETYASRILNVQRSALTNCVSAHYLRTSLSFAQLERFLESASTQQADTTKYNLGSLSDEIVVSINLRPGEGMPPSKSGKKRSYDDSADRAKAAIDAARKRLMKDEAISEGMLKTAERQIERMFRDVKGANGELIFESLGLSVTPTVVVNASASASPSVQPSTRPKLIVACRLSAGIGLPIYALRKALSDGGAFPDGMMTTNPSELGPEYRLPLSELGRAAEGNGQRSILLFAAVPQPPIVGPE